MDQNTRTKILIGDMGLQKLKNSTVAIFGLGGVGSYVLEALARAGVGNFCLIDKDKVDITNINRQIIATNKTIGMEKVVVAKNRVLEINKDANVEIISEFFSKDSKMDFNFSYIVDAIDTVSSKIELIKRAKENNVPIISSMGTGNKLDPTKFEVSDIYKTSICPLAKVIRKELKKQNIDSLKVVYSKEVPIKNNEKTVGSISFVPSVCGLIIASEVVKDIISF